MVQGGSFGGERQRLSLSTAREAGRRGFTPSLHTGLKQAGLCLTFPSGCSFPGQGVLLGESLCNTKGGPGVFCKRKLLESTEDSPG